MTDKELMQPCAGRNCGSTNPNLHSAECFEDYEKATGMAQQEPYAWEFAGTIFHDREEVFAWFERGDVSSAPPVALYTRPQAREWVGLTDDEVSEILDDVIGFNSCWGPETEFARAIEAKLKEKNGDQGHP